MPHPLVKHCQFSLYDIYIGAGTGASPISKDKCIWANPFPHAKDAAGRRRAAEMYEQWLLSPQQDQLVLLAKKQLRGKVLACWCAPRICHGEVLARYVRPPPRACLEVRLMCVWGEVRVANETLEETNIRRKELGLLALVPLIETSGNNGGKVQDVEDHHQVEMWEAWEH
jgi:hypothetical protein